MNSDWQELRGEDLEVCVLPIWVVLRPIIGCMSVIVDIGLNLAHRACPQKPADDCVICKAVL